LLFYFQFFCTRLCLHVFGGKILREAILNFLTKMLSVETLCKVWRMRILGAVFLSLLAGKLKIFKQMLTRSNILIF